MRIHAGGTAAVQAATLSLLKHKPHGSSIVTRTAQGTQAPVAATALLRGCWQKKVIGKNPATFAGGVVPCALVAVLWVPRAACRRSGARRCSSLVWGCSLCVLCRSVLAGVVSLLSGFGCLGSLRALVLVVFARCLLLCRVAVRAVLRRWCLGRRGRRAFRRWRSRPMCSSVGRLLVRGSCGRGGRVPVRAGSWRSRSRCPSRRSCRLVGGLACWVSCGVGVGRRGRLGRRRGRLAVEVAGFGFGAGSVAGARPFFYRQTNHDGNKKFLGK